MKRLANFLVCLFLSWNLATSQSISVTGRIVSKADQAPLPGATVIVLGKKTGTVANLQGVFYLETSLGDSLEINFLGMRSQTVKVANGERIFIELENDALSIDEAVITGLAIQRNKKSQGYAISSIGNEKLTNVNPDNLTTALAGKMPGVVASSVSGSPGASSKIIIRGYNSFFGNNAPLYIIDGVPVSNRTTNYYSGDRNFNAVDFGSSINTIDVDDIASIHVHRGAAATALYGSQGSNGVIVIETKRASTQDLQLDYSGGFEMFDPLMLPSYQNMFGQGFDGEFVPNENVSWGPPLDGRVRPWGREVNGEIQYKPYAAQEDNLEDFYERGTLYKHNVSLLGGSELFSYRLAYSNQNSDGIVPGDKDYYKRNSLRFRTDYSDKKLSIKSSFSYSQSKTGAIASGHPVEDGGEILYRQLTNVPRDISIVDLKDYKNNPFNNADNFYTEYAVNPYVRIDKTENTFNGSTFYGMLEGTYRILPSLSVVGRFGGNYLNNKYKLFSDKISLSEDSKNDDTVEGMVREQAFTSYNYTMEGYLNYRKNISTFNINLLGGGTYTSYAYKQLISGITELETEGNSDLRNSANPPYAYSSDFQKKKAGYLIQADISFKDMVFFNVGGRYEWSSTLYNSNDGYFYPGVNTSVVLSELFPIVKSYIINYIKVRGAYGIVGSEPDFTSFNEGYVFASGFPRQVGNTSVQSYQYQNYSSNKHLKPEISKEWELGTELNFLSNRIKLDFTYYNRLTDGQIFYTALAPSSGSFGKYDNIGLVENEGIEIAFNAVPINTSVKWEVYLNYTKNNSLIKKLEGAEKYVLEDVFDDISLVLKEGEPVGTIEGPAQKYVDGKVVVNSNGIPIMDGYTSYGNVNPDFIVSGGTSVSYKGFKLGGDFDFRKGGKFFSYTSLLTHWAGNAPDTRFNNRQPFIVPNSIQEITSDGGTVTEYIENKTPITMSAMDSYWSHVNNLPLNSKFVVDRTYFKLRELYLSYSLPIALISKAKIKHVSVGVYGRNLFIWTPDENNMVDPEGTNYGNDINSEFGEFATSPTVKTYGLKLNLSF